MAEHDNSGTKPTYKMVLVEWTDSYGCASVWGDIPDQAPIPHLCFSAGWLVRESDSSIVIVPHISPKHDEIHADEQGCGDMTIPRCSVTKIIELLPNAEAQLPPEREARRVPKARQRFGRSTAAPR